MNQCTRICAFEQNVKILKSYIHIMSYINRMRLKLLKNKNDITYFMENVK